MKIFVTGCCGYIGSHTCVELLKNNYEVIGLDNFSNSKKEVLNSIKTITGKSIKFYEGNMLDSDILNKIFKENVINCVIDFAAYKAVGESVEKPISYYVNNVSSVLTLLNVMINNNCKKIVLLKCSTNEGQFNKEELDIIKRFMAESNLPDISKDDDYIPIDTTILY